MFVLFSGKFGASSSAASGAGESKSNTNATVQKSTEKVSKLVSKKHTVPVETDAKKDVVAKRPEHQAIGEDGNEVVPTNELDVEGRIFCIHLGTAETQNLAKIPLSIVLTIEIDKITNLV